jgi:hypothetical protein
MLFKLAVNDHATACNLPDPDADFHGEDEEFTGGDEGQNDTAVLVDKVSHENRGSKHQALFGSPEQRSTLANAGLSNKH